MCEVPVHINLHRKGQPTQGKQQRLLLWGHLSSYVMYRTPSSTHALDSWLHMQSTHASVVHQWHCLGLLGDMQRPAPLGIKLPQPLLQTAPDRSRNPMLTCALVSFCMSDSLPQSALQPNLLKEANSNGASQMPSPQIGSTHTVWHTHAKGSHHSSQDLIHGAAVSLLVL